MAPAETTVATLKTTMRTAAMMALVPREGGLRLRLRATASRVA
jgi:hypothetical protein